MASVDFEVTVENIYPDLDDSPDAMVVEWPDNVTQKEVRYDEPSIITVTLEMSIDGDYLPSMFATEEEWEEWGEENILPLTGTGRTEGDAGYAAEITAVTSLHRDDEYDYIVGQKWEWL